MVWKRIRVNGLAFGMRDLILGLVITLAGFYFQIPYVAVFGLTGVAFGFAESRLYRVYVAGDEVVVSTIRGDMSMRIGDISEVIEERSALRFLGRKYVLVDRGGRRMPIVGVGDDLIELLQSLGDNLGDKRAI
ncbi:MAG: hypothetical protein QI199_02100 [Candidatus Korarchaeota archaeon]|nr:hypothetical protein [Candidatus Korarchaeota archaeon]